MSHPANPMHLRALPGELLVHIKFPEKESLLELPDHLKETFRVEAQMPAEVVSVGPNLNGISAPYKVGDIVLVELPTKDAAGREHGGALHPLGEFGAKVRTNELPAMFSLCSCSWVGPFAIIGD